MGEQLDGAGALAAALQAQLAGLRLPMNFVANTVLYKHVCEYVDGVKALGWPPERVIVNVKRIALAAGLQSSTRPMLTDAKLTGGDAVMVDMVRWCIERYYDPTDRLA